MSDEKTVQAEVTIDADAETVWRAISEGEEIKRWFTIDARVTPGAGGAIWMSFGEGMDWETPIQLWEPNRHLRTADPEPSKLAVDYYIESKGGETVLRLVHSGFAADAWDDELENLSGGWRAFLAVLKNYLEQHRGEPRALAYFRHPAVPLPRPEVFSRLLGALGVPLVGEGQRFDGPIFEGIADVSKPPVNFSGALANWNRGFLFVEVEPGREKCRPAVWVSLYGDAMSEAPALQARLQELLTRAFSGSVGND